MKPITLFPLSDKAIEELDELYRTTKDVRIRTRVQMVLLSGEQGLVAGDIADIVRQNDETVRIWLKRYQAEGTAGLYDEPRSGAPAKISHSYKEKLVQIVRQRPRSLGLPFSRWPSQRLADYMAEETVFGFTKKQFGIISKRPRSS